MNKIIGLMECFRKLDAINNAYINMPNQVAAIAVNFSKERFRQKDWVDVTRAPWDKLARRRPGSKKKNQSILVDTGRLKKSIRKIEANQRYVIIGTDVEYAQIHNEGGLIKGSFNIKEHSVKAHSRYRKGRKETVREHTVKSHTRMMNLKIPQRQFLGDSDKLERELFLYMKTQMEIALKK